MSLVTSNKRVLSFFHERPNLDFDTTILKFIDIMESLYENMNNTLNNTTVLQILDNLKTMQVKIDNVSSNVNKIQSDTQLQFSLKMTELKKEYIDDIKMILSCNVSDKIEPLLKEQNTQLFEKTCLMINSIVPKNEEIVLKNMEGVVKQFQEGISMDTQKLLSKTIDIDTFNKFIADFDTKITNTILSSNTVFNTAINATEQRLDTKMSNITELSSNSNLTTNTLNASMNNLLKKFENSNLKGKLSENIVLNVLAYLYPKAVLECVGQTKETGDIIMMRKGKPKILIENKLWTKSIVQTEVIKFIRDIDIQKCSGIFLSQNSKITTKEHFEINIHEGHVLIYLHYVNNDPDKIQLAVDVIDNLEEKLEDLIEKNDKNTVTIEMLEYINIEYQNFVASKIKLIKLSKEFNQNFLKQIDEIKLPNLENYLSSKYAFSSNKFICEYCSYVGKNQQSKAAHLRGCVEKKKLDEAKGTGSETICIETE